MPNDQPIVTVFTPTYQRAHTLPRVYAALSNQTLRDFEWLVIDDGSTDGTADLIAAWQRDANFTIRYHRQEHAGKPAAYNTALRLASAPFFVGLDSDDECLPHALERLLYYWKTIPSLDRANFVGVAALAMNPQGVIIGSGFPDRQLDSDAIEIRFRFGVTGDKWSLNRTSVLREYPFIPPPESKFVSEDAVWFAVAHRFRTRFVGDALLVIHRADGTHLSALSPEVLEGRLSFHEYVLRQLPWRPGYRFRYYAKSLINYSRYSFDLNVPLSTQFSRLPPRKRLMLSVILPAGWALAVHDRRQLRPVPTQRGPRRSEHNIKSE